MWIALWKALTDCKTRTQQHTADDRSHLLGGSFCNTSVAAGVNRQNTSVAAGVNRQNTSVAAGVNRQSTSVAAGVDRQNTSVASGVIETDRIDRTRAYMRVGTR